MSNTDVDPRTATPPASAFQDRDPVQEEYFKTRSAQQKAIDEREKAAGAQAQHMEEDLAQRDARLGQLAKSMGQAGAYGRNYPQQQTPPDPPNPEDYHKINLGYLATMVMVGAIAGKGIRNVANAPLNAFAGAAKGWNDGNQLAYKEASQEWEQKNRKLLETNRQQLEKYRAILENKRLGISDQMQLMKIEAANNQDRIMYDATKSENFDKIATAYGVRLELTKKMEEYSGRVVDNYTSTKDTNAADAQRMREYTDTPQGQAWLAQHSPAQQMQLKGFMDTWAPPTAPTGASSANLPPDLRGPQPLNMKPADMAARQFRIESYKAGKGEPSAQDWANFNRQQHPGRSIVAMELEAERDRRSAAGLPPMTAEEEVQFEAERGYAVSALRSAGNLAGRQAGAFAAFKRTLPQASEASTAVGARSKWVPYNQLKQNVALQTSNPVYQQFVIANETAITDYAMAIGRGGGMTVHAQERAAKLLNTAMSDQAYQAGLRQLEKEADAVSAAPAAAKRMLLHQLFPNAPQEEIEQAVSESVLPPAPAAQGGRPAGVIRYDAQGNRVQ